MIPNWCKLCLFKTEIDEDCQPHIVDIESLLQVIKELFDHKISVTFDEAKAICKPCTEKLQYCHEYVTFCVENQKIYLENIESVQPKDTKEEVFVEPLEPFIQVTSGPDDKIRVLKDLRRGVVYGQGFDEAVNVQTKTENELQMGSEEDNTWCDDQFQDQEDLEYTTDEEQRSKILPPGIAKATAARLKKQARKRAKERWLNEEAYDPMVHAPKGRNRNIKKEKKDREVGKIKREREERDTVIKKYFEMKCEDCNIEFETYKNLQSHMLSLHTHKKMFVCCGSLLATLAQIHRHALDHDNPVCCPHCGYLSYGKTKHTNHMLEIHGVIVQDENEEKIYQCDLCCRKFTTKKKIETHMNYAHLCINKTFVCETCAVVYKSQSALNIHIKRDHLKVEQPKSQCPTCGKWILTTGMPFHMRSHLQPAPQEKFKCNQCGSEHRQYKGLLKHIRRHHSEASNRYKCSMCPKGFFDKKNFEEHFAVHTGEILYTCEWCNAGFKSGGNYLAHKRKLHPILYQQQKLENKMKREELSKPKQMLQGVELKRIV